MTTFPVRILAGAAVAALVLGTFSAATAAPASPPAAEAAAAVDRPRTAANYMVPKVGSCHLLTQRQASASSDARRAVPCSGKHTTVTIAVKRLSGAVNWNNRSALVDKIAPKCERAKFAALGRNDKLRSQTAYGTFWFRPTPAQIKRGAAWLRCDLALAGGAKLMPLPADVTLGRKLTDRVARCLTAQGHPTVCKRPHAGRAAGAFRLSGAYPTPTRALATARRGCGRFTGRHPFTYSYPGTYAWKAGSRAMVCYIQTSR